MKKGTNGKVFLAILVLFCAGLWGCGSTALQTTGKTLLAVQATADAALTSADALCDAGALTTEQCTQIAALSTKIKAAYTTAADAYLVFAAASDEDATTAQEKYDAAKTALDDLVAELTTALTTFGVE